jgi:hypothetical protein
MMIETYDAVRREVLYNILIESEVLMKLVRLIKTCLIEMYSEVRTGKNLYDNFLNQEWSKTRRCFIAIAYQGCFRISY